MFRWSVKNLCSEPVRLIVSALAVGASFILVIFFSAVFEGESVQMVAYLKKMDADVWVMQKGVSNMHMARSMLWDWKADKIARRPEVREVAAMLYLNGPVKVGGKDWFSYVIGLAPNMQRAGPWAMARGRPLPGEGEAVIPEAISKLTGVGIGDSILLIDRPLTVVGLSRETFSMSSAVVFVSRADLGDLLEARDQISYIMVYAEPGVSAGALAAKIESEVDRVHAMTSADFIESDRQLALQMGVEIIRMMTVIGTLLATLILGFSAYTHVVRKSRELAMIKALGFGNARLYAAGLFQSLVITALAFLLALLAAFTLLSSVPTWIPQISLNVHLRQFVPIALLALPMAALASLAAVRTVAKVDPVTVFQD